MVIGLFARADHPVGYGSKAGTAHGWVVIGVRCKNKVELREVITKLLQGYGGPPATKNYHEGYMGDWYGGRFDFIGTIDGELEIDAFGGRFRSFGDNRFAGLYMAPEVLG